MHIAGKRQKEPKSTSFRTLHWTCFRNAYLTLDEIRGVVHQVDLVVKGYARNATTTNFPRLMIMLKNLLVSAPLEDMLKTTSLKSNSTMS